ncbi:39S ribosomal protein L17 [Huso huso]|uniref:Large ribosomal subunit protein bL17m n=1 Tax=Huso huso TaxID=61971 RepID=A0ABR0YCE0_HUSHU
MRLTLPVLIAHGRYGRRMGLGPESRINMLRNILTGLVRHERIETTWARADEVRIYAEKVSDMLISFTRPLFSCFSLVQEKDLVHKLFKVLVPRLGSEQRGYTRLFQIPNRDSLDRAKMAVLELRGNPFPPLVTRQPDSDGSLLNQLLRGYREEATRSRAAGGD